MSELLVFLSSIMDKQREDLFPERDAAKEAIQSLGLMSPWRFEDSPASSLRVDYSYLNKVAEADIFLLLLGRDVTAPVRMEFDAALGAGKPVLVFLKKSDRTPEAESFVKELKIKWKTFDGPERLKQEIRAALAEELINAHRHNRMKLPSDDVDKLNKTVQAAATSINAGDGVAVGRQSGGVNLGANAEVHAQNVVGGNQNITENRTAGGAYYEARDHGVISVDSGKGANELVTLLDGMAAALGGLKLSQMDEKRVRHALEGAKLEADTPSPDRKAVATRLKEVADLVTGAGTIALEATTFGKLLQQGLTWAGQALPNLR